MALIDEVKVALRVKSPATDPEIHALVEAAFADMARVGVDGELLDRDNPNALVKSAILCFCKARYGYDNEDAARFEAAYRQTVIDLMGGVR